MNQFISIIKKVLPVMVVATIVVLFDIGIVHAQDSTVAKVFGLNFFDFISQAMAQFFFQLQTMASWLIIIAGYLLNFSVNLTLHIKEFVDKTPAIFTTWKALRDLSGMFIIFFLLYAAIQLITGLKKPNFNDLIKNIVLAGVLINFSFFFAGLGIDASNLVSIQLYNAIAPKSSLSTNLSTSGIDSIASDGGLSDIFMSSLKIPNLYDVTGNRTTAGTATGGGTLSQPIQIMLIGITSIMIMVTAAFSFGLAAIMFIVRFVVLLFLLAFSPVMFMSFISPELKTYTGKWTEYYKNMLIIMPVYLLLMYVSLSVLTSNTFFGNVEQNKLNNPTASTPAVNGGSALIDQAFAQNTASGSVNNWYGPILSLAVNAVIVIFMMNVPLIGAIAIGGGAVKFLNADKMGAGALWSKVGNWGKSSAAGAGANTVGRGAFAINDSKWMQKQIAKNPALGGSVSRGLASVGKYGFGEKKGGYKDKLEAKMKDNESVYKQLKDDKLKQQFVDNIRTGSVMTFLLNNRAGNQSGDKLEKQLWGEQLGTNKAKMAELAKKKAELLPDDLPESLLTQEEKKRFDLLDKEMKDLAVKIEKGEKSAKDQDWKKLAEAVAKENKQNDDGGEKKKDSGESGGGGGKKEEKKA